MYVVRALRVCGTRLPLWPAACLSGVPRAPCVVRRASSGPVALGALVGLPDAVVPFPSPGAWAPGFIGRLRGARGGRPRTGLIVSMCVSMSAMVSWRTMASCADRPGMAPQRLAGMWGCRWGRMRRRRTVQMILTSVTAQTMGHQLSWFGPVPLFVEGADKVCPVWW